MPAVSAIATTTLPIAMGLLLVLLLFLMGLNLTLDDMRRVRVPPVATSLILLFLVGPVCAVALCHVLCLEADWALGILLVAVTPPTVGASVFTFIVGGDTATALTTSVVSLLLGAGVMPACFAAEVALFNTVGAALDDGTGGASRVRLQLPLAQIAGAMALLVLTAAGGLFAHTKLSEATREKAKKWIMRALRVTIVITVAAFAAAGSLVEATFYGGRGALRFWLAATLVHLVSMPFAIAFAWREEPRTRDAVILTSLRRNPVIMLGVAALSFSQAKDVDFDMAFGIVAAAAMTLDWVSFAPFAIMRKARYGRIFGKLQQAAEKAEYFTEETKDGIEGEIAKEMPVSVVEDLDKSDLRDLKAVVLADIEAQDDNCCLEYPALEIGLCGNGVEVAVAVHSSEC